jgi:hypothetical protein
MLPFMRKLLVNIKFKVFQLSSGLLKVQLLITPVDVLPPRSSPGSTRSPVLLL